MRRVHQSPSTQLNLRGLEQARTAGEYLRAVNADFLITSPYDRALQTARIIGSRTGLEPKRMGIFREVDRPFCLANTPLFSARSLWYVALTFFHRNNPKWRYRDAENLHDVYARVRDAYSYIESLTEEHDSVIIISHSVFINLMVTYMCNECRLSFFDLAKTLLHINELKNCDVTHVEYNGPAFGNTCAWQVHSV